MLKTTALEVKYDALDNQSWLGLETLPAQTVSL